MKRTFTFSRRIFSHLLPVLLLLAASSTVYADNITISGVVTNSPHNAFPATEITARNSQGEIIGNATTLDGTYSLNIASTSSELIIPTETRVFPNPFDNKTSIIFVPKQTANHTIMVYNVSGQVVSVMNHQMETNIPVNIEISGIGRSGIYLAQIAGNNHVETFRLIKTEGNYNPNISVTDLQNTFIKLKSADDIINLSFKSSGHDIVDTAVVWNNHSDFDIILQQIPEIVDADLSVEVQNLPMEKLVEGAEITVFCDSIGEILNGITNQNGIFYSTYQVKEWIWDNDTIRQTNQLKINITSSDHHSKELVVDYHQNIDAIAELQQIKQLQTFNITLNVINNPMNKKVEDANISIYNEHDELITDGNTDTEGNLITTIDRQYYSYGVDTLVDYDQLIIIISYQNHNTDTLIKQFEEDITINHVLEQIKYSDNALLDINLTSIPLNYIPDNVDITVTMDETELTSGQTTNGTLLLSIPYDYHVYKTDTLWLINDHIIETVNITASHLKHETAVFHKQFSSHMTITGNLQQIPVENTISIVLQVVNDPFGYSIAGAEVLLKNAQTDEILKQGITSNGVFDAELVYNLWEHQDLSYQDLNQIYVNVAYDNHKDYNLTVNNHDHEIDIALEQIPENKTSMIEGVVTDKDTNEPIDEVMVTVKEYIDGQYETLLTTTTNEQGNFQANVDYILYVNQSNAEERNTIPEHITVEFEKENYTSQITDPIDLQENITLDIELQGLPQEKTLNFTFKPITVNGDPQIPDNIIHVRLGNVIESYVVGTQQEINVNITAKTSDDYVTMWDEPPVNSSNEPWYNEVIIMHEQNREWHTPPIKNNNQTGNRTTSDEAYDTLRIDMNKIQNRHDLELIKMYNYFDHPDPKVGRIYTNGVRGANFITKRAGYHIWSHAPTDEGEGWQILFKTYDEAVPENDVSQKFIDNWSNAINQVMNASTRNDGQKTFDWKNGIHYVDSPDDPKYVEAQNNDWINTLRIVPNSEYSMATNAVSGGYPHHMWGHARTPPAQTSVRVALEETLEPTYRFTDPETSSVDFILKWEGGEPINQLNDFAIRGVRYRQQLSHGTRFDHIVDE